MVICTSKRKEESKELLWHLLPLSNKELLRKWLIKIKHTNTSVSKNSYFCSKHFEEECFIKPLGGQRIRLKPGSVPTKFVFTVQRKERKRPCCRGEATLWSGLVHKLKYRDCIMADRGFNIQEMLASKGVSVNVPPFMNESGQFEERQLVKFCPHHFV